MIRGKLAVVAAIASLGVVATALPADAAVPVDPPVSAQVVGGTQAPPGKYPYVAYVAMAFSDGSFGSCTGSVVAPRWVLTAGHCVLDADGTRAIANGTTGQTFVAVDAVAGGGGTMIPVSRIFAHPGYDPAWTSPYIADGFDAALLELASATSVTPVKIMSQADWSIVDAGVSGTIVGWGDTNPNATPGSPSGNSPLKLNEATVTITSLEARTIQADSTASSSCYGDSGGPLLVNDSTGTRRVAGIVSNGDSCNPPVNIGTSYTDVANVSDWLGMVVPELASTTGSGAGSSGRFNPVSPQRLLDTRGAGGMPHYSNGILRINLTGVPASATAVTLNLTTVNTANSGYISAYSCDRPWVYVYTVSFPRSQATPNLAVVPVGSSRQVCIRATQAGDLVADLAGWYEPSGSGGFTSLNPTRVLDTRFGPDPRGNPQDLVGGTEVKLTLRGANGVAADATAVLLNVTGVTPAADGYITAYPCDQARPTASNLNPARNQIVANQAAVTLAADGSVCLYSYATTDLVVDLNGYFSPSGSSYIPYGGVRVADTSGANADVVFYVGANETYVVDLGTSRGFASGLRAASLDVTAFSYDSGYITAYACDQARPTASNLNYAPQLAVTNLVTVPIAANGKVCLYSYKDAYLTVDLVGTYQ